MTCEKNKNSSNSLIIPNWEIFRFDKCVQGTFFITLLDYVGLGIVLNDEKIVWVKELNLVVVML